MVQGMTEVELEIGGCKMASRVCARGFSGSYVAVGELAPGVAGRGGYCEENELSYARVGRSPMHKTVCLLKL